MFGNPKSPGLERSPEANHSPELHEGLKEGFRDKVADAIKERVTKKILEHFERRIDKSELDEAADNLFNKFLQGASEADMEEELRKLSAEIAERRF